MNTSPWPLSMRRSDTGEVTVAGLQLTDLADRFGTPLWVVDEADLRSRCRAYRNAFEGMDVYYASKAWCAIGIIQIIADEGLGVDVASGGELHAVQLAGAPASRVVFHGNNKSEDELVAAAAAEVGRIVIDSFEELHRVERVGAASGRTLDVWLRVTPGIDAHTHDYVKTGHDDTKFGFTLSLGLADEAMAAAAELPHVDVVGAHAHVGSQIFGVAPFAANAAVMIELLARWRERFGVTLGELNLGGGMAVRYTHEDHTVDVDAYATAIRQAAEEASSRLGFPKPRLGVEPGRGIVAPSTMTLYRVGVVKRLPGLRTYVSVDGGMSDNPRPALYQAEHEVAIVSRAGADGRVPVTVVGKHCEPGDLVRDRTTLPADVEPGDLLAVAATGAYTASMASNYNCLPRPAAVAVRGGDARILVRRETYDDVVGRDMPL